ncbi:hypothetical protein P2318_05660 [Myxococcaceae bacterium GXIMD 01537]
MPPPAEACTPPRNCPASCVTTQDCGAGQECNGGLCVNALPTVSQWRGCTLDADCPSGDFCKLGACTHDCVSDRDCAEGRLCDVRGRCAQQAEAGKPAAVELPAPLSPALAVDETRLDMEGSSTPKTLTVRNTGGGTLEFRVLADKAWLDAEPSVGQVGPGKTATVRVRVSTQGAGEASGTVTIIASGGTVSIPISVPHRLRGLYRGEVHLTRPAALGSRALAVHLSQAEDGTLSGVVDDRASPSFAFRAALHQGSAVRGDEVEFAFALPASPGSRANPSYPHPLERRVWVKGRLLPSGAIRGTFREEIRGLLSTAEAVVLEGTVVLGRQEAGLMPPAQTATVTLKDAEAPVFPACSSCPAGATCTTDTQAGQAFLLKAFPFYSAYAQEGYTAIRKCVEGLAVCFDAAAFQCAQARFSRALQRGATESCMLEGNEVPDCARRGLLDTFQGLYAWHMLAGNELRVRAHLLNAALPQQQSAAASAATLLQRSAVGDFSGTPPLQGLMSPYFLRWVASLPAEYFATQHLALLPQKLQAPNSNTTLKFVEAHSVPAYGDVSWLPGALTRQVQAAVEDLEMRHRLAPGDTGALTVQAERAMADAHISLAAAAALLARTAPADTLTSFLETANAVSVLSEKARQLAAGLNPVGISDSYIAYTYNPVAGAISNNFLAQLAEFRAGALARARQAAEEATGAARAFESSQQGMAEELSGQASQYAQRLVALCGGTLNAPAFLECGKSGGEAYEARQEFQAAQGRAEQAAQAITRVYQQVDIEQNRAAQVAKVHRNQANLILANGERINALTQQAADAEQVHAGLSSIANAFAGLASENPYSALGSLISGIVGADTAQVRGRIEKEKNRILTTQQAQVEFNIAQEALIESSARVKTWLLEVPSLKINFNLALLDTDRALARLKTTLQAAIDAQEDWRRVVALRGTDPRFDPAFRLYRDVKVVAAERTLQVAMKEAFILTRSLEYEMNISYGARASLFRHNTVAELETYAAELSATHTDYIRYAYHPQARMLVLSLRDDVFKLTQEFQDRTTGVRYTPAELFHRFLGDPRNRDTHGNLRLAFTLSLTPGSTVFNSAYCAARLTGLRASLVGAELGVTQPEVLLQERGSAYLRACEKGPDGAYEVREYGLESTLGVRRAVIQAGVNLSGPNDANSPPFNTELYGRPISANYELVIDRTEPANRNLNLSDLDDILLFVAHETRTTQP